MSNMAASTDFLQILTTIIFYCITNGGRYNAPSGYTFLLSPTGDYALLNKYKVREKYRFIFNKCTKELLFVLL
jgi:hypothetical protein